MPATHGDQAFCYQTCGGLRTLAMPHSGSCRLRSSRRQPMPSGSSLHSRPAMASMRSRRSPLHRQDESFVTAPQRSLLIEPWRGCLGAAAGVSQGLLRSRYSPLQT